MAVFWNKSNAGMAIEAKATQEAAGQLGVTFARSGGERPEWLEVVLEAMRKIEPDGFLALMDITLLAHRRRIIDLLAKIACRRYSENAE